MSQTQISTDNLREFIYTIPESILFTLKSLAEIKIYMIVRSFMDTKHKCWAKNSYFAQKIGIDERSVRRAIESLESKGFIRRTVVGRDRYLSIPQNPLLFLDDENDLKEDIDVRLAGHTCPPREDIDVRIHIDSNNNNQNNNIDDDDRKIARVTKKSNVEKSYLVLDDLLEDNPHHLPAQMLSDFLANRKSKRASLTRTAWKRICKELAQTKDPLNAFEQMIMRGWIGIKADWINNASRSNVVAKPKLDFNDTSWADDFDKGLLGFGHTLEKL